MFWLIGIEIEIVLAIDLGLHAYRDVQNRGGILSVPQLERHASWILGW